MWKVYASNKDCCAVNFPFSEVCHVEKGTPSPTKYPTLAVPEESNFETIPFQFSVRGLPDDVNMRALKEEMKELLTAILTMIATDVPDMKITSIDEREARRRNMMMMNGLRGLGETSIGNVGADVEKNENSYYARQVDMSITSSSSHNQITTSNNYSRQLLKNVEFYYDINIIRVEGKQFGPLIIQYMKDSISDIQNKVQTTKTTYFQSDVDYNFCTLSSGKYTLCTSTPEPVVRPVTQATTPEPEPEGGLPGWAIAIIVIFVMGLVGCLSYLIYVSSRDGNVYDKEMEDMYANEMTSGNSRGGGRFVRSGRSSRSGRSHRSRSSRSERSRSSRSRRSSRSGRSRRSTRTGRSFRSSFSRRSKKSRGENSGMVLAIAHAEEPTFGDEFTLDTYKTAKKRQPDPSVYNPHAVDPDGGEINDEGVLMLTMGEDPEESILGGDPVHRRYREDPPLKPKREPTMYVDGAVDEDGSLYSAKFGQGSIGSINQGGGSEEDPFGDYGQKTASMYMGSASGGEFQRGAKDPSFYQPGPSDRSFDTQEPSVGDSKKSRKSRASTRRHVEESLASSWADVME